MFYIFTSVVFTSGCYGATSYDLFEEPLTSNPGLECIQMYNVDVGDKQAITGASQNMRLCPCSTQLATWDPGYSEIQQLTSSVQAIYLTPTESIPQYSKVLCP